MRNNHDRSKSSALIVAGVLLLLFGCGESKTRDTVAASVAPLSAAAKPVRLGREEFERALAPRLSRSAQGLEKQTTRLGGGRIDLRNRFQHVSIVRKRPDGTAESICVTSSGELHAALTQAASP